MNNQTQSLQKQEKDDIDLLELIYTVLDGKWSIIFFTLFASLLAFAYAYGSVPIYRADVLIQVEKDKAVIPGAEEIPGLGGGDGTVSTEIIILKSRKILGKAVDDLALDVVAYPMRLPLLGNLYKRFFNKDDIAKLPFSTVGWLDEKASSYAWGGESIKVTRLDVPSYLLNQSLSLVVKEEEMFDILYKGKFLLKGKLNRFVSSKDRKIKVFIQSLNALPGTNFVLMKRSKLSAIEVLQKTVRASEKGKKTGVISLALEGKNKESIRAILDKISTTYLSQNQSRSSKDASSALGFLQEQIKPVKQDAENAEARLKSYRTKNQTADISKETQAVLDVVAGIDTALQKLSLRRDELGPKYTRNHPIILSIASQESQLRRSKKKTLSKISKLPETQQELLKLESDYRVANKVYLDLLNKVQEFKIIEASSVGNVYIIDDSIAYDLPVKPRKLVILAIGALMGGLFSIGLLFLRKAMHRTVGDPEKLEEAMNIPVYATVPLTTNVRLTRSLKSNKKQKSLLALENGNDPAIESLRSLRTSLHFALIEAKNNIVMITGPSPGIGKSFISSNFSAVLGAAEQNVLLIDADMRKGYLHDLIGKSISPGLSDVISGKVGVKEAIHTVKVKDGSFDVITRGQTPPNPSELLMHSKFKELLDQLSQKYDLVIIDTPPVHAVTDPTVIGKHAGVVFMVVFSEKHSMQEIEHAVTRLSHTGIDTKGFIFNGYIASKNRYGYGSYGYGSYGGYYSDNK